MIPLSTRCARNGEIRAAALVFAIFALGACESPDQLSPNSGPASQETPGLAAAVVVPGIAFASFELLPSQLNTVHTGIVRWTSPSTVLSYLSQVRAKGGRVLLKLHGDEYLFRNPDNTFNLTKWKTMVDRYKTVNFSSYVNDGTIIGHYIIDEPHYSSRWGGKVIPQATVEAMAKYSKQLWPALTTITNAQPAWLAAWTGTYTYLDAGWAMYMSNMGGPVDRWAANHVAAAKRKGLGMIAGLNLLDGGNGSSGFHGNYPSRWAMSAAELRSYGKAILAQTHVCGFVMWKYKSSYHDRPDIKIALNELGALARTHAKTSCRQ